MGGGLCLLSASQPAYTPRHDQSNVWEAGKYYHMSAVARYQNIKRLVLLKAGKMRHITWFALEYFLTTFDFLT